MNKLKAVLSQTPTQESLGGALVVSIHTTNGSPISGHLKITQLSACGMSTIEDDLDLEFSSGAPRFFDFRVVDSTCLGQYTMTVNFVSQSNEVLSATVNFNF